MKSSKKTVQNILHYSKIMQEEERNKLIESMKAQNKYGVFHLNLFGVIILN